MMSAVSLYDLMPAWPKWRVRMFSHILVGDGCWGWAGHHSHDGYARYSFGPKDLDVPVVGRDVYVHVYLYELFVGKVPDGMELDHRCKNRGCTNFEHLEPVIHIENLDRRDLLCKRGHLMSETRLEMKGRSCCGVCYRAMLDRQREQRVARGLKRPWRKPKSSMACKASESGKRGQNG